VIAALLWACARPPAAVTPAPCPPPPPPRSTQSFVSSEVPFELVLQAFGDAREPGGAAVGSGVAVAASVDEVTVLLRRPWLEGHLPPAGAWSAGPTDARYLVVWWPVATRQHPVLETVWLRPTETLASLLSRARRPPWPPPGEAPAGTSVQVFRLPAGEYPAPDVVYTELPAPAQPAP
jgi:hypothetical protein